jgi:hypothetical protein
MADVRKTRYQVVVPTPGPNPSVASPNAVPDLNPEAVARVAATAPLQTRAEGALPPPAQSGNPRPRRYRQKTYSVTQADIDIIEQLTRELRQAGLFERGRSDVVRAGVWLLAGLSTADKCRAVEAVENLKS